MGARHPVFWFPSQPTRLSLPRHRRADLSGSQSSSGFLCLLSHSALQMNCMEPAFILIPFPAVLSLQEERGGERREGTAGCLGDPGMGEAGAGCVQRQVTQCLRDLQEKPAASTGMSLESWQTSLRDLGVLRPTSSVCNEGLRDSSG